MKGKTFMARYADDAIIGCEEKKDASLPTIDKSPQHRRPPAVDNLRSVDMAEFPGSLPDERSHIFLA
jgi:hypothetical protein